MYKEESGTVYHRLQEDSDILGEKGQVLSPGSGKVGKFFTLCIVCDTSKNMESVEPKRQLVKNDLSFIDPLFDLFIRHPLGIIG